MSTAVITYVDFTRGAREASVAPSVAAATVIESVARPRLRLTTRGRVVFATLALIVLVALGFGAASALAQVPGAAASSESSSVEFTYVTVGSGESLWDIASGIAGDRDVRDVVEEISALNHLDGGGLEAGQRIALPLWA